MKNCLNCKFSMAPFVMGLVDYKKRRPKPEEFTHCGCVNPYKEHTRTSKHGLNIVEIHRESDLQKRLEEELKEKLDRFGPDDQKRIEFFLREKECKHWRIRARGGYV